MTEELAKSGRWRESEIMKLISMYKVYALQGRFDGTVRDSELYRKIAKKLAKMSIVKSHIQIRTKLKSLKRKYRIIRDCVKQNGPSFKHTFRYYQELDNILGGHVIKTPPVNCDVDSEDTDSDLNVPVEGGKYSLVMKCEVADDYEEDNLNSSLMSPDGEGSSEQKYLNNSISQIPLAPAFQREDVVVQPSTSQMSYISTTTVCEKEKRTTVQPSTSQTFTSTTTAGEKDGGITSTGQARKRMDSHEETLRNILKDTTDRILHFQEAAEKEAEAKREAFRKELLKQNQEMIYLLKAILRK